MQIHFLRHATLTLTIGGQTLLVDPMLSRAATMEPVPNAANQQRIPLVDLPIDDSQLDEILASIDAALVTHTHRDHWDDPARDRLPRHLPILCQPEDVSRFAEAGFAMVQPIDSAVTWQGLRISRTSGQHGTGEIGRRMGPVSGFVIAAASEPSVYIAGDTIWCAEVEVALRQYRPAITIVNAGAAQFLQGDPITMTADDVIAVCRALPETQVIAVHMDTINHCLLRRADLVVALDQAGLHSRVLIPADGERIDL